MTSSSTANNISYHLLKQQNAATSSAILAKFDADATQFDKLATFEGTLTAQRDAEDDAKLQAGVDFAKSKGVIDPNYVPEPYVDIDVLGKTPNAVADTILEQSDLAASGVVVLVGLSGTGKGTTMTVLRQKLEANGRNVVTWSNGNIFRSVTLLAATWCDQQDDMEGFDATKALTKENLVAFMNMLSFGKFKDGKYDTRIQGLGLNVLVSEVQNTILKSPQVSKNIPTVAEATQGEVITFAAGAVETMGRDGIVVLLEGREQTVNYVRTPNRFALTLSDATLIGKRRAAQRLAAHALATVDNGSGSDNVVDDAAVDAALDQALEEMVQEVEQ